MKIVFQSQLSKRALGCVAACGLAAALLASCGGQTSSSPASNGSGQNAGGSGGGGAPILTMGGAYQGSLNNSDFVSFLTPSPELNWAALYYLQTNGNIGIYPDIYRGTLGNVTASSANIASLTAYQFGDQLSTGSASISGASASSYQVALNGIGLTNHISNPTFNAAAITSYAVLPGTWTGRLTDNKGASVDALSLTFNNAGALTSSVSYANCPFTLTLALASASSNPYYTARLDIPPTTGCTRSQLNNFQATVLTGIGFIHDSPATGRSKRLEIILTDSTGSGISFRGDQ